MSPRGVTAGTGTTAWGSSGRLQEGPGNRHPHPPRSLPLLRGGDTLPGMGVTPPGQAAARGAGPAGGKMPCAGSRRSWCIGGWQCWSPPPPMGVCTWTLQLRSPGTPVSALSSSAVTAGLLENKRKKTNQATNQPITTKLQTNRK